MRRRIKEKPIKEPDARRRAYYREDSLLCVFNIIVVENQVQLRDKFALVVFIATKIKPTITQFYIMTIKQSKGDKRCTNGIRMFKELLMK